MSEVIRVAIVGVCGKMGQETARAVSGASDMRIVGACDLASVGSALSSVVTGVESDLKIESDLATMLRTAKPDVVVDFTAPSVIFGNAKVSLSAGVATVIGTTGLSQENIAELRDLSEKTGTPALIAPNFAIGAVLMMRFAAEAAKYMPSVEIIELHHDKKLDSPSGTSIKTAEMIADARGQVEPHPDNGPARGEMKFGVPIHSVRLQGFVAHQEVIFGGQGQTLTIRHDSIDRTSFMPGVLLGIRKVRGLGGLVYGLDNLL